MQRLALLAGLGLALAALWVLGGGEPPAPRLAPLSSGAPERSPTRPTRRVPLPAGSRALPSPEPAPRGPRSLRGRVLDEAGQPIPGARVALRALPAGPVQGVVCDEAGAFAFSAAPSGPLELIAIAEGWALPAPERLGPEADQATLTLRRLTLRGRVVGELPRPDLRVEALPNGEGIALSAPVEAGAFQLPLPASGVWWLRARQEGAASPWLRVEVDERSPADLELALAALAELRGVVRDEQGRPLAGAEVVARDRVGRERRALSDAEGEPLCRLTFTQKGGIWVGLANWGGYETTWELGVAGDELSGRCEWADLHEGKLIARGWGGRSFSRLGRLN